MLERKAGSPAAQTDGPVADPEPTRRAGGTGDGGSRDGGRGPGETGAPKDRKLGRIVLPILILVLALAALGLGRFYTWATGASGPKSPVEIEVPAGASGSQVADLLQQRHVIRSAFGFRILARVKHSGSFDAGTYVFTTNMTASDALATLEKGPTRPPRTSVRLTIPEGFDAAQVAARVAGVVELPAAAYLKAANGGGYSVPGYLPPGTKGLEGFLFPDTYFVYKDATAKEVIDKQLAQFEHVASELQITQKAKSLGVSPLDVVIVASIIEREAKFPQDRAKVAEVIYNRLKKGMKLQMDSTVAYAAGIPGQHPSHADYLSKNPYNTYVHLGLPPGPISNPGEAALKAALAPSHEGYLYFLTIDKAGHDAFTASYEEFLRLKANAPT